MARAAASLLIAGLGTVTAFTVIGSSSADEPIPYGAAATVYRTLTETRTMNRRVEGHTVGWWRARAIANRKQANARRITLRRIQAGLRAQLDLGAGGLERAFLCIHQFEGAWTDPNAPYYGGLQMDWDFMATYGAPFLRAYGPANNWTPAQQLVTAQRAYLEGRGFGPWPNTSRMCGLR